MMQKKTTQAVRMNALLAAALQEAAGERIPFDRKAAEQEATAAREQRIEAARAAIEADFRECAAGAGCLAAQGGRGVRGTWTAIEELKGEPQEVQDLAYCLACEAHRSHARESAMPRHEALRALGVPAKYRHTPEAAAGPWPIVHPLDAGDWREFARCDLAEGPRSLIISGTSGAGKSTRAAWLLSEFWRLGWRPEMSRERRVASWPVWISAPALTAEAKSGDRERPLLRAAMSQPLIVFDDALYARRDGFVDITLETFGILSARYDAGFVTIVTTMRPVSTAKAAKLGQPGESWQELGPAAYRRMADDGWFPRRLDVNWSAQQAECEEI